MGRFRLVLTFMPLLAAIQARSADVDVTLANSGGVYDAVTAGLYCITGGSVTPVNPVTGATETPVVVSAASSVLSWATALTQSGSQFYVAHDGGRRVARINLVTRTVAEDFSVGVDANGDRKVAALAAMPGETNRVAAVTTNSSGSNWRYEVFQGGVSVAASADVFGFTPLLFPGDGAGELCAITDPGNSACKLVRLSVSGALISAVATDPMPTANSAQKRGRYIVTSGSIWDSTNHLYIGNPPGFGGPFDLDEANDRMVAALGNGNGGEKVLTVVEPSTGAEIHEQVFSLPGFGQPMPLLVCGAGRVAHFHENGIALRDFGAFPQAGQADLAVRQIIGPSRVTVGEPISVTALVRNASQTTAAGATLHWSGMPVSSATQVLTTSGTATVTGGEVDVALGDLAPGAQATVTINFSSLAAGAPASTATVSCATTEVTTANNTHVLGVTLGSLVTTLNLPNGVQTVYDRASRHVFTLIGEGSELGRQASFWAGQIAEIEPETARIVAFHRVPGRATCFAVEAGRILVGLRNNGGIVSRALAGGNWTAPMPVGAESTGRPLVPMDVAVGLAAPETLVVARQRQISVGQSSGFASAWEPAAAVQAGVVLPSVGPLCTQVESGRNGEVFGIFSTGDTGTLYRFSVGAGGLTKTFEQFSFADAAARLRYHERGCFVGSDYFSNDGANRFTPFNAVGMVADPDLDRLYWFETRSVAFGPAALKSAVRSTGAGVGSKPWSNALPDSNGNFAPFYQGDLLRWGDYGLLGVSGGQLQFSEHPDLIPPPPVRVQLPAAIAENAGTVTGGGTVELARPTTVALTVTLTSSHPTRLQVPASVTIPAGAASVAFDMTTVHDPVLTGPVVVTVTPSGVAGYTPLSDTVSVTDAESTVVGLTLPPSIAENSSAQGTITLATAAALDFLVALSSSDERLALPASVVIPAGQTSVNFTFQYLNDDFIDDATSATITATAAGWVPATAQVAMQDNEPRTLTVGGPFTVTEGSGSGWSTSVTLGARVRSALTLQVSNSDAGECTPAAASTLTVPAGESVSSGEVSITAIDDADKDGAQAVTLTVSAPGFTTATISVTVRDNDPASFLWPAIPGPVTAGSEVSAALRAITIDGDEVALSGAIAISATVNGQPGAVYPASVNGVTTSSSAGFLLTKAGTTTITATAGDVTGMSAPFAVQAAALSRFVWSPVTSPVLPGVAQAFTISATDAFGNLRSDFNGTVGLSAHAQSRTDTIGAGADAASYVLNQSETRARCQALIHANALAGAGQIRHLALELLNAPARPYDDVTIRIKHTTQNASPGAWESTGWTVVRQGPWVADGMGWKTLPFQIPFDYDGTSNLFMDISFANASPAALVLCQATAGSGAYAYVASTSNTSHGLPVTWSGTTPAGFNDLRPNLKLGYGTALSVAPGTTTAFVNGAWTGDLALTGAAQAYAVLEAAGGGATGTSAVFEFGRFPPAAPVFDTEPGITQGTTNTVSWAAVPLTGGYYVERAASSDFTSTVASGWITQTSHTFTGLADGESWYYRVKTRRADDTSVESAWSNTVASTQDNSGPEIHVNGLPFSNAGTISTIRPTITLAGSAWDSGIGQVTTVTVNGQTPTLGPLSGGPGLIIFGAVSWSINITTPASGSVNIPIVATDLLGNTSTRTITLVRVVDANADGLPDDWQQTSGLTGGALPPADAGPDADPDKDGFTNLMEFARGTDPLVFDAPVPLVSRVPSSFGPFSPASTVFEYDRRMSAYDLIYQVQSSTDLAVWSDVSTSETTTPNPDGITEHVSVSISDGGGLILGGGGILGGGIIITPLVPPPKKFLRLQVTLRP